MAAMIFSSAILIILLALSNAILPGNTIIYLLNVRILLESNPGLVYLEISSSTDESYTDRISPAGSHSLDLCLEETWRDFLPFSNQDITIAMDIEIQPGPYSLIPYSTGSFPPETLFIIIQDNSY